MLKGRVRRFHCGLPSGRNRRISPIASGRGDGLLSDHRAGAQLGRQELVFMPPKAAAPPALPERLAVTDDHEPTFTGFLQTAAVDPQQLYRWPSDRANYVVAAKIKKTQEKWINAYCLRLFASVSYFTHARSVRLYGLTDSKAARGEDAGQMLPTNRASASGRAPLPSRDAGSVGRRFRRRWTRRGYGLP
jgi:hypothetical protein